jgi:hypothetical protein
VRPGSKKQHWGEKFWPAAIFVSFYLSNFFGSISGCITLWIDGRTTNIFCARVVKHRTDANSTNLILSGESSKELERWCIFTKQNCPGVECRVAASRYRCRSLGEIQEMEIDGGVREGEREGERER